MSTEAINKTSNKSYKCNIALLKQRLLLQKKKEIIQNRIILASFCLSLGLIGYFII